MRDYIERPKPSGYRAQHLIVKRRDRLVEVQLRTVRQDSWANQVEDDGRQLATDFKFGAGDQDVHDYYETVAEAFAVLDRDEDSSSELRIAINERFQLVKLACGGETSRVKTRKAELTENDIRHFLITYDLNAGKARVQGFGEDYDRALAAYAEAEEDIRGESNLEVVLVGADSIETVERTHLSYFHTEETFESLLPAGVLSR